MMGNKAGINQAPTFKRKVGRLSRVRAAIAQLEEQLKTPFRYSEAKTQAESKLAKLKAEEEQLVALLAAAQEELQKALKPVEIASA